VLSEGTAEILFEPSDDTSGMTFSGGSHAATRKASAYCHLAETKDQPRALIGVNHEGESDDLANANRERTVLGDLGSGYYDAGTKMAETASPATAAKLKVN
jgi:hypothetical protein